jgi:hypothetical protein
MPLSFRKCPLCLLLLLLLLLLPPCLKVPLLQGVVHDHEGSDGSWFKFVWVQADPQELLVLLALLKHY